MRHVVFVVLVAVGCQSQPPLPRPAVAAARMIPVELPRKPHTSFSVTAAELGDPQVTQRIPHRVRLQRLGKVWLRLDSEPERVTAHTVLSKSVLPVADENRTRIRVVIEDDGARFLVWVDRNDAAPTIVAPIQLADRQGRAPAEAGAWLDPGVLIELGDRVDRRRELVVQDPALRARGWVPNALVGEVWTETSPRPRARVTKQLAPDVIIRAAPDATSPDIATSLGALGVAVVRVVDSWTEIELVRPFARVRGFVPSAALGDAADLGSFSTGGGHGFGMSHSDYVTLVEGVCLFDQLGGEVIGVNLEATRRHAHRPDPAHPGWWRVYIDSPWSAIVMWAHDQSGDPKAAAWETCGVHAK